MASNAQKTIEENTNNAVTVLKDNDTTSKKNANVVKKDYILNDLEAIKKKLDNEYLSPAIQITKEASNGISTTVSMKTSLFEFSKCFLMEALKKDVRVTMAEAVLKVTAETNFNGDADVEFQLEITFKIANHEHKVKVLC